ncbi:hypothetical protein SAMN04488018_12239 [Myroides marinus]|uniref:Lipoprotein n=1 Tax=Myroides marinus TaxID=703342 RepID=A0A1H6XKA7_9FLAO|nr:hypothetical protein [Myroides marinus]SEJ29509.1 hypothetical protein SAMN04488018_12239 [Myroides marinus]
MKNLIVYFFVIAISCSSQMKNKSDKNVTNTDENDLFKIAKIDSINSFYIIYCTKDEQNYKIISKKEDEKYKFEKINESEYYSFELTNFPDYSNSDNPLTGFSSIEPCFMLDKDTQICKEQGIKGLYTTKNLKGLYYIK